MSGKMINQYVSEVSKADKETGVQNFCQLGLGGDDHSTSQLENRIQFLKNSNYMEHFQVWSVPQLEMLVLGDRAMVTSPFIVAWGQESRLKGHS